MLEYLPAKIYHDVDAVIEAINGFGAGELWNDLSPIWYRPQYYKGKMYKPRKLLQVVGHTPVESITKKGNLISCDICSTSITCIWKRPKAGSNARSAAG